MNIRKEAREGGKEYIDINGHTHRERAVQETCSCRHNCGRQITAEQRENIHEEFWNLSDSEKRFFYSQAVVKTEKKRTYTQNQNSRKKNSFKYYLRAGNVDIQVCKVFFFEHT